MTNAGWYPDPAGAPDTYRYWDGQSWSQMTTSTPPVGNAPQAPQAPQSPQAPPTPPPYQQAPQTLYGAVPPSAPPPPGGGYGQPQWSPSPQPGAPGGSGGSGKTIGIVIAAVLALVLLGVAGFFGVRALTGDDDEKAADGGSQATEQTDGTDATDGTDGPTDGTTSTVKPTGIQCTGGSPEPSKDPSAKAKQITGGGLTVPVLSGYTVEPRSAQAHAFADSVQVQYREVIADKWISEYAVGGLPLANGFQSPEEAAEIVMQCVAGSDQFYADFSGRKDLKREAVTIDGKSGYRITAELRVSDPAVTVGGDDTTVIVVDTGSSDTYGLFLGVVPIGDGALADQLESTIQSIKVG